jgi:hypothetical protein
VPAGDGEVAPAGKINANHESAPTPTCDAV